MDIKNEDEKAHAAIIFSFLCQHCVRLSAREA